MNIFVFGASCSGKSTLGAALKDRLGDEWTYLDRDNLIEKEGIQDSKANQEIDHRLVSKTHMIIDAQIPWREPKEGELYFHVFCPVQKLIERDEMRKQSIQRTPQRAYWASKYVVETFIRLQAFDKRFFHQTFNSSEITVEEEVDCVVQALVFKDK